MAATTSSDRRPRRRRWARGLAGLSLGLVLGIAGLCWWLTEPLGPPPAAVTGPSADPATANAEPPAPAEADWPEGRLEGPAAKRLLLRFVRRAGEFLSETEGYAAIMNRRERIDGELGPDQTLELKVQHDPFAVYIRFRAPKAGKEAIYSSGRFDDQVIAHNGDWTRYLVPRLKLDPDGPVALADNRHPITDIGLANLTRKLIHYRELDLEDPHAETVLDRVTDDDGREWLRSIHLHPVRSEGRPFAYVEVLYCPDRRIPLKISSYDWPEGDLPLDPEQLDLVERYHYRDVDFDTVLTALDFDPSNPDYGFQRY